MGSGGRVACPSRASATNSRAPLVVYDERQSRQSPVLWRPMAIITSDPFAGIRTNFPLCFSCVARGYPAATRACVSHPFFHCRSVEHLISGCDSGWIPSSHRRHGRVSPSQREAAFGRIAAGAVVIALTNYYGVTLASLFPGAPSTLTSINPGLVANALVFIAISAAQRNLRARLATSIESV